MGPVIGATPWARGESIFTPLRIIDRVRHDRSRERAKTRGVRKEEDRDRDPTLVSISENAIPKPWDSSPSHAHGPVKHTNICC